MAMFHENKLRIGITLALFVVAGIAVAVAFKLGPMHSVSDEKDVDLEHTDHGGEAVVKLSADKLRVAQLHAAPCQMRALEDMRTVPGKITYNEALHLEIKTPVEGVVQKVLVSPAESVRSGQRLAILSSPEIGLARDAVAQCRADFALARKEADRTEQIAANLAELVDLLNQHPNPAEIEKKFDNKALGEHRQELVAAYSKLFLAEAVAADTSALEESGGISGRLVQQRHSDREVARAAFETACEQSTFDVARARDRTLAAVQHAERLLAVNCRRLLALGGDCSENEEQPGSALSDLALRAPFDGVVEERLTMEAAHVAAGQPLFVLANIDTLWVSAEVPERDWNALGIREQSELTLQAPSLRGSETVARVKFTAGKISPETRTLTMVGELDNRKRKFRPGMFVWVSVPMGQPQRVLAVPVSAIVQHEQTKFVFVADGPDTFHRANVATGLETPEWVEITEGLKEGQSVVDSGTLALKSELLLEHE